MGDVRGPLGIDPFHFSVGLFCLLVLFVLYLLLPRGFRVHHFRAYPKRYAWSARSKARRGGSSRSGQVPAAPGSVAASSVATGMTGGTGHTNENHRHLPARGIGMSSGASAYSSAGSRRGLPGGPYDPPTQGGGGNEETVVFNSAGQPQRQQQQQQQQQGHQQQQLVDLPQNDEIVISAAMQQLRDPGVLIVAHGSRGKPKTVRLRLTESAITWRTETRKKSSSGVVKEPKLGKLHQVPLSHIMYVDVGKQTTALRRVENAAVSEALCFSLLTKEGSLDLEANSPRERDALVSCFSLVLDEVHAQNWRDIYRGPSSEMPSSFDDFDQQEGAGQGGVVGQGAAGGQGGGGNA